MTTEKYNNFRVHRISKCYEAKSTGTYNVAMM